MERSAVGPGIAEQFLSSWTSNVFRSRCAAHIELARCEANPQENSDDLVENFLAQKSSKQLEEFVFAQSKTREDYMSLVAEMIMMLRQHGFRPRRTMGNTQMLDTASPEDLTAADFTGDDAEDVQADEGQ